MLTATGLGTIANTPEIKPYKGNAYFNFELISKHPRNEQNPRCYYKVSVFVPKENLAKAKSVLQEGTILQLRIAELDSNRLENGTVFNKACTSWGQIEVLK